MKHDPEIHCSADEGRAYRDGVYLPLDASALPNAPANADFPDPGHGPPFRHIDDVPKVPKLRDIVGPSVIALGMGLGAGEFLLWPNLIAVNGFSIWWLFWIGVVTQFIVIGEIERWSVATGESILTGMKRMTRVPFWPWFFLAATLISFFWPGWASQSADFTMKTINAIAGRQALTAWQPIAIVMMLFIWFSLALSQIVYNALEKLQIVMVLAFFPLLFIALMATGVLPGDVVALAKGALSIGQVPQSMLSGAQFPVLLIAVAYAGSGGTLLLAQSLWVREKGFGMGAYQGRIAGMRGQTEVIEARGFVFSSAVAHARRRFAGWMRVAERELLVTFVLLIILSVVITSLLISATIGTGDPQWAGNMNGMVAAQAEHLRRHGGAWLEVAFLLGGAFVLFSTQVGIVDSVTRISGDILHDLVGRSRGWSLRGTFLALLTFITLAGIAVITVSWKGGKGLDQLEPNFLILIAGPFMIASMYLFTMVIAVLNTTKLPAALRMPRWKLAGMYWAVVLWGWVTAETVSRFVLGQVMGLGADPSTAHVVHAIAFHPVRAACYALWLGSLGWLIGRTMRPGMALHRETR
jgi:hypothetical protein